MKKIFIIILLFATILPTFATIWEQVSEKSWIDIDSIEPFIDDYGNAVPNQYSFWVKSLNDGSDNYKQLEKHFNKKVWYSLSKYVVDINTQKIAQKTSVLYAVNEKQPLDSYEEQFDTLLRWQTIVPNSVGELMFNIVRGKIQR